MQMPDLEGFTSKRLYIVMGIIFFSKNPQYPNLHLHLQKSS